MSRIPGRGREGGTGLEPIMIVLIVLIVCCTVSKPTNSTNTALCRRRRCRRSLACRPAQFLLLLPAPPSPGSCPACLPAFVPARPLGGGGVRCRGAGLASGGDPDAQQEQKGRSCGRQGALQGRGGALWGGVVVVVGRAGAGAGAKGPLQKEAYVWRFSCSQHGRLHVHLPSACCARQASTLGPAGTGPHRPEREGVGGGATAAQQVKPHRCWMDGRYPSRLSSTTVHGVAPSPACCRCRPRTALSHGPYSMSTCVWCMRPARRLTSRHVCCLVPLQIAELVPVLLDEAERRERQVGG